MDYQKRYEAVEAYSEQYFKPEVGTYKIVCLGEAKPTTYTNEHGDTQPQIEFQVSVTRKGERDIKELTWSVNERKTVKSLYGQLMVLAYRNKNKLSGLPFTLIVRGNNTDRQYIIPEVDDVPEEKSGLGIDMV